MTTARPENVSLKLAEEVADHPVIADAVGCSSCGEEMPRGECPKSPRECGHHCNHSWSHEVCHWCGMEWGLNDEVTKGGGDG